VVGSMPEEPELYPEPEHCYQNKEGSLRKQPSFLL